MAPNASKSSLFDLEAFPVACRRNPHVVVGPKQFMRTTMTRILALTFFLFSAIAVSGCNTIQGAGEDIENAGEELEDATEG